MVCNKISEYQQTRAKRSTRLDEKGDSLRTVQEIKILFGLVGFMAYQPLYVI